MTTEEKFITCLCTVMRSTLISIVHRTQGRSPLNLLHNLKFSSSFTALQLYFSVGKKSYASASGKFDWYSTSPSHTTPSCPFTTHSDGRECEGLNKLSKCVQVGLATSELTGFLVAQEDMTCDRMGMQRLLRGRNRADNNGCSRTLMGNMPSKNDDHTTSSSIFFVV